MNMVLGDAEEVLTEGGVVSAFHIRSYLLTY